jgi:hypothetical protein
MALAERWDGTSWATQATPKPAGATSSQLNGVSCSGATNCVAVGYYSASGKTAALVQNWNGGNWTIQATPNPSGTTSNRLTAVSCNAAAVCTAVGPVGLAERRNGGNWVIEPTVTPSGGGAGTLNAVSCSAFAACTAVGSYYVNSTGRYHTLAERWNGTGWAIESTPNAAAQATGNFLYGVSCAAAAACAAAGVTDYGARFSLAESWNGSTWAIRYTANPGPSYSQLFGVSCTVPTACMAVGSSGSQDQRGNFRANSLVERWDGTKWMIQAIPAPPGTVQGELNAVSCIAASECTVIGDDPGQGPNVMFAERWNGTGWAVEPMPSPPGTSYSQLLGVSCTATTACTAVGCCTSQNGPLAESWDGSSWTIQPTPGPPAGALAITLRAASCTAPSACTAVGDYFDSSDNFRLLAERWDGTRWSVQQMPANQIGGLSGVSCVTAVMCSAVGWLGSGSGTPLAMRWNGTDWSVQPTPKPGVYQDVLNAVSCASVTSCTAVGLNGLAEGWDGSGWAIQPTPQIPNGGEGVFAGVSCTAAAECTAAGSYASTNVGDNLTLAERYS